MTMAVVLVVARSAPLRESLAVLLQALPQIGRVEQAEEGVWALTHEPAQPPDLVLLDGELRGDKVHTTLRRLKAAWPQARCLVMVDDEEACRQGVAAGADAVLVKGVHPARLLEVVEGLLSQQDHGAACGAAFGIPA